jgi:hypothetical protein
MTVTSSLVSREVGPSTSALLGLSQSVTVMRRSFLIDAVRATLLFAFALGQIRSGQVRLGVRWRRGTALRVGSRGREGSQRGRRGRWR